MTPAKPMMTPHQLKTFSEWYVRVVWPSGREQNINGFETEAHARGWIEHESPAWIAKAEQPRK